MFLTTLPLALCAGIAHELHPKASLLIAAPGQEVYQLEGHAGLRITDPDNGIDMVVNWGLFDFNSPNFLYRFVKGETDYLCGAAQTSRFLREYIVENRPVEELELNLSPAEIYELLNLLDSALLPENRTYRYNYVMDNCATRPLSLIEQATGDTIAGLTPVDTKSPVTFRSMMRRYHANYPWYQFGIDLALGPGIDRPITPHEQTFAPVALPQLLSNATLGFNDDGSRRQLIVGQHELLSGNRGGTALDPTPWYATPLAVACLLLVIGLAITLRDWRTRRTTRWFDSLIYTIIGVGGLIVAFLVFISTHESTTPNWVILWINPLALIAAVGVWLKSLKKVVICYQFINFGAILALLIIGVLGVQSLNAAFYPLMLLDMLRAASYIRNNKW